MKTRTVTVILTFLCASGVARAGGEVAVFPVAGDGTTSEENETIGVVFAKAFAKESGKQVLLPGETASIAAAAGDLVKAANALAAFEFVSLQASRQGSKFVVTAGLFSKDGKKLHEVAITALSLDDFEMMAPRMALALHKGETVVDTRSTDLLDDAKPKKPVQPGAKPHPRKHKHKHKHDVEEPPAHPMGRHIRPRSHDHIGTGEVAVFPVAGTNLQSGEAAAIGVLFARAYAGISKQQVLLPEETEKIMEAATSLREAAQVLAVAEYVDIRAVRLTTKIQVSASLHKNDGNVLHYIEWTAASLDDFQIVSRRMAKALHDGISMRDTRAWDDAAGAEASDRNKLFVERIFGVKLQMGVMLAEHAAYDPQISLLFDARFEGDNYFIEFGAGAMIPSNAWWDDSLRIRRYGGLVSELGASYYFMNDSISLYAGGGILPRLLWGDDLDVGVRMAVYAQGGAMFFRDYGTRLYSDLRLAQNIFPYQSFNLKRNQAAEFYPFEITLSVGAGW